MSKFVVKPNGEYSMEYEGYTFIASDFTYRCTPRKYRRYINKYSVYVVINGERQRINSARTLEQAQAQVKASTPRIKTEEYKKMKIRQKNLQYQHDINKKTSPFSRKISILMGSLSLLLTPISPYFLIFAICMFWSAHEAKKYK